MDEKVGVMTAYFVDGPYRGERKEIPHCRIWHVPIVQELNRYSVFYETPQIATYYLHTVVILGKFASVFSIYENAKYAAISIVNIGSSGIFDSLKDEPHV